MKEQRKKVMIVDDDYIHLYIVKRQLELNKLAGQITTFNDGNEALEHLENVKNDAEQLPDLILLDLNMPEMDGFKFLQEYRKVMPKFVKKVKLYVVSSSVNPIDVERAMDFENVSDYIVKPIDKIVLKDIFLQSPAA